MPPAVHDTASLGRFSFFADRTVQFTLLCGFLSQAALWTFLLWQIPDFTSSIPLHYNIYYGVDQFGPWWLLFRLPAFATFVWCLNTLLGWALYRVERPFSLVVVWATLVLEFLLCLAGLLISLHQVPVYG